MRGVSILRTLRKDRVMNVAAGRVIVCALLLAGTWARAFEVKSEDFTEDQIGAKAFILLSTSNYMKPSIKPGKNSFAGVSVLIRRVDSGDGVKQKTLGFGLDNPFLASHFAGEHAMVHWRAIEPGEYTVRYQVPNSCLKIQPPKYRFRVKAGDVVYLGDFHFQSGGTTLVLDGYQRDFSYFAATARGVKPAHFLPLALQPDGIENCQVF